MMSKDVYLILAVASFFLTSFSHAQVEKNVFNSTVPTISTQELRIKSNSDSYSANGLLRRESKNDLTGNNGEGHAKPSEDANLNNSLSNEKLDTSNVGALGALRAQLKAKISALKTIHAPEIASEFPSAPNPSSNQSGTLPFDQKTAVMAVKAMQGYPSVRTLIIHGHLGQSYNVVDVNDPVYGSKVVSLEQAVQYWSTSEGKAAAENTSQVKMIEGEGSFSMDQFKGSKPKTSPPGTYNPNGVQ